MPILGIVENMSYFICPECGHRSTTSSPMAVPGTRRSGFMYRSSVEIPLAMPIRETSDGGRPIVASDPDSAHAKAYVALARQVKAGLAGPARAAPRIVIE